MITFKPKQITKELLSVLPERARDVLEKRYGLTKDNSIETLESIGQSYGITRERVRQIENYALASIKKSDTYKNHQPLFDELGMVIEQLGSGVVSEETLLETLAKDKHTRNHVYFILALGTGLHKSKENNQFASRWFTKEKMAEVVEKALVKVYASLKHDDLISESEILDRFRLELAKQTTEQDETVLRHWLAISKQIGCNPLGDWGPADSPNVRVKGIRDYAYLTVKRHGSPMHFKEVSENIKTLFEHNAHVATTHNELIKDKRFVLVGRGLYALSEWGYTAGVVKDVLREILLRESPLSKEELIDRVRKERYVKDNTIVVNLQDTNLFKRLSNGTYSLVDNH